MVGEIIETENWKGKRYALKVIADIGAPEEISADHIEIISFPVPKEYSPDGYFDCVDARDYLNKADAYLGLHHTNALLKTVWRIPEEWKKFRLFFPGTILREKQTKMPYMPYMYWCYEGWVVYFHRFFRSSWSMKNDRFVRWRR